VRLIAVGREAVEKTMKRLVDGAHKAGKHPKESDKRAMRKRIEAMATKSDRKKQA